MSVQPSARHARIISTGAYVPPIEISNEDLIARLRAGGEEAGADAIPKFEASTGITRRWSAPDDWATSDLALEAAKIALDDAGRRPQDVDLIILGTDSPDFTTPATSVVLQHKLGAVNAGTFDVGCACASFPTGAATAAGLIAANGHLQTVLVVGAYLMRRLADPLDPTIFFYGDGAGAAVFEPSQEPGFVASAMRADGAFHQHWGVYAGGTAEPASVEAVREGRTHVRFIERYPPEVNHEGWPEVVRQLSRNGGFSLEEIDLLIFTQVRKPSIEIVMDALGLPLERAHTVMEKWGYTGSACVPMALDDAVRAGKVEKGDLVALVGSGVGYNQAGVAFRW